MKKSQLRQIIKEEIQQLLKEDDPRVSSINIGDKFQDEDTDIWTVKDIFIPEWTTEVETITLENEDGESTVWPDDFDGGGFFEWFNQIEDVNELFGLGKRREPSSFDEPAWFESIATAALTQLQQHHKWKEMELAAMGPGDNKTYMNMAITPSKFSGPEYEFKVHFDENDNVIKIEDQTPEWRI